MAKYVKYAYRLPQCGRACKRSTQLIDHIRRLVNQPQIGHPLNTLPGVREWVARDYVVHYVVTSDTLTVLQIWHGREER